MIVTILLTSIISLVAYVYLTSSNDSLDISIIRTFSKILFKLIPGYAASLRGEADGTFRFKEIKLEGEFTLKTGDLIRFSKAVGSASNPFLLNAVMTPLVITLLADSRCPIKPAGSVNTKNIIRLLRPFQPTTPLRYVATFGAPGHRRKRGVEAAVSVDVYQGAELVMQSELWFLAFLSKSFKPVFAGEEATKREDSVGKKVDTLELTPMHPRLWAASCKDYNPIHISKTAAKLFGQKTVIAHGNHVAALVIEKLGLKKVPVTIEPEFLRPVTLPGVYDIVSHDGGVYTVQNAGKVHFRLTLK